MTNKLTPAQRRTIFLRWIEGNRILAAGGRPETMPELAAAYGVTPSAINWIVRDLGGDGNRRRKSIAPSKCCEPGCDKRSRLHGRCPRHEHQHRWKVDPAYRQRKLKNSSAYRARQIQKKLASSKKEVEFPKQPKGDPAP